jgi:hypothetical protein
LASNLSPDVLHCARNFRAPAGVVSSTSVILETFQKLDLLVR